MTRRWQREMDNAAATAEAKAIDAERDAAIVRDEYYNGESARWLDPITPEPTDRTSLDLQLSINRELMKRLDALETKVKNLEHMLPV
jgi:hypothetical protein